MVRCNRDNKGRFTEHLWPVSWLDATSRSSKELRVVKRICLKCGLIDEIESFACMASKAAPADKWMYDIAEVLAEENEILADIPFVEVA